jgi:NADPH-dependent 2,4-dienoyl-CoA reductase/sulfur reductase-like enzyme
MKEVDLVIVGGGPAGISAAVEAARRGVSVILIDENRSLGGKVLKQDEGGFKINHTDDIEAEIAHQLLSEFERIADKVSLYLNTEVWSINAQRVVELFSEDQSIKSPRRIQGKKLLISAGALERAIPFPGWTLPGVYTVGGLNALIKKGVSPGKNFLIAGSGPLLLVLAREGKWNH